LRESQFSTAPHTVTVLGPPLYWSGNPGVLAFGRAVSGILLALFICSLFSEICRYRKVRRAFPSKFQSGKDQVRVIEDPEIVGRVGK
jgi:hypothetical protein